MALLSPTEKRKSAAAALTAWAGAGALLGCAVRLAWPAGEAPERAAVVVRGGARAAVPGKTGAGAANDGLFPAGATPFQQMTRALGAAEGRSAGEIRALLERAGRFPGNGAGEIAKAMLLRRWVELEPEEALRFCQEHEEGMLPRMLGSYAAAHPEGVGARVLKMPPGRLRQAAWGEVAHALSLKSPDAAWDVLGEAWRKDVWDGASRDALFPALKQLAGAADAAGFTARARDLPPRGQLQAREALCARLADSDGRAAWELLKEQPTNSLVREAVWEKMVNRDPATALALLAETPEVEAESMVKEAVFADAGKAAEALSAAAAGLSASVRERLARRILAACEPRDLAAVAVLLPLAGETPEAGDFKRVLGPLAAADPAKARAWVESLPEGPVRDAAAECLEETETNLTAPMANRGSPTRNDRMLAAWDGRAPVLNRWQKLAQLPPEQLDAALRNPDLGPRLPMDHMAVESPEAVAAWLSAHESDNSPGTRFAQDGGSFASAWGRNNPAAAAAWAASLPEGNMSWAALYRAAREYARYAPAGTAEAWAAALPAGPRREAALKGVGER